MTFIPDEGEVPDIDHSYDVKISNIFNFPDTSTNKTLRYTGTYTGGTLTIDENERTVLTDVGKKFLENQTKNAAIKVELAKLKNLEFRKSLERKTKSRNKKRKKKR